MTRDRIAMAVGSAAAALLACMSLAADASAHTHLASTTPRDGARIGTAPRVVVLRFTQPIDARTAVLRVVDERGTPLAVATSAGAKDIVRVALRRPLADGDYAVGYRVLASDGHAMSGGLAFTVAAGATGASAGDASGASAGDASGAGAGGAGAAGATGATGAGASGATGASAAGATGAGAARAAAAARARTAALVREAVPRGAGWPRPVLVAARAGQYAGLVLALGGLTFLLLAWWPALAAAGAGRDDPAATTWRRTLTLAMTVGAGSAAAGLVAHAFDAAGAQPTAARLAAGLGDPAAILWAEATACWIVAALMLRRRPRLSPRAAKRLLVPLAGALLATALAGHGAADGNLTAAAAAIAHGTAAAIWIGALAWLMIAARRSNDGRAIVPGAAARVSRLSLVAAVATLASGTIQAIVLAGGPLTLAGSSYGRLVLVKLALFGGLVALGTVHRTRTLPGLRGAATASRPLRTTLRAELVIATLVLAAADVLTGSTPPQPAQATPSALAAER